jgi:hypothetical protein
MNTASKSSKRVSKKTESAPVAPPAPVEAVAPAKAKKTKHTVAPVEDAPVATPVATAVAEGAAVESKTIEQEIASLIETNQKVRDAAVNSIKALQRLQQIRGGSDKAGLLRTFSKRPTAESANRDGHKLA